MERATSLRALLALLVATALVGGLLLLGSSREADARVTKLTARLRGSADTDGNGRGRAAVTMDSRRRTVCFNLRWSRIGQPFAAHIHAGRRGQDGPVVVGFFQAASPEGAVPNYVRGVRGCVPDVPRSLIRDIRQNPRTYYVNVHNARFAGGAIRGQLRR